MKIKCKKSILGNIFYELRWKPYKNSKIELFVSALTEKEVLEKYEKSK